MAVYKEEKTNTWRVIYRYTDWTGERKQSQRRGFKTKREALAWEREQLNKSTADLDITFASFVEQYTADMKTRIKENTWATKDHIIGLALTAVFTGPAGGQSGLRRHAVPYPDILDALADLNDNARALVADDHRVAVAVCHQAVIQSVNVRGADRGCHHFDFDLSRTRDRFRQIRAIKCSFLTGELLYNCVYYKHTSF